MTAMKVPGREFWFLQSGGDAFLFDNLREATVKFKEAVEKGAEVDEITMYVVDISGENWRTAKISWKDIAMELAKLGK